MKRFRTTGVCNPNIQYMVDITDKIEQVKKLIEDREKYLRRIDDEDVSFKSVILAGVYDIKNLKLKLRPNEEKKYNSHLIEGIIIDGKIISFNLSNPIINLGAIFGIFSKRDNKVSISNRIYEQYIYDYLSSKIEVSNNVLEKYNFKSDFIQGNGLNC